MIECRQICRQFGEHSILRSIDCTIPKGKLTAITGPSGCGKTTLLNIIGGLDKPSSGSVVVNSQTIESLPATKLAQFRNTYFGFIFQHHFLIDRMSALDNVVLPLIQRQYTSKRAYPAGRQLLEEIGLGDRLHHMPHMLSSGQKQRVAFARALVGNPKIILADEPTGALDSDNAQHVFDLLSGLTKKDITVVLITHDPRLAKLSDQQIMMKDGAIYENQ